MATYDVRLNGANPYVKNGQNRVAVELNNGLVAHITDKQFAWYFKDVKVDECTGVSAMVTFFDKGEKNIIRNKVTKAIEKEIVITEDNIIVKNIALIRGKLAIETVATALAIQAERSFTIRAVQETKDRVEFTEAMETLSKTVAKKRETVYKEMLEDDVLALTVLEQRKIGKAFPSLEGVEA